MVDKRKAPRVRELRSGAFQNQERRANLIASGDATTGRLLQIIHRFPRPQHQTRDGISARWAVIHASHATAAIRQGSPGGITRSINPIQVRAGWPPARNILTSNIRSNSNG